MLVHAVITRMDSTEVKITNVFKRYFLSPAQKCMKFAMIIQSKLNNSFVLGSQARS